MAKLKPGDEGNIIITGDGQVFPQQPETPVVPQPQVPDSNVPEPQIIFQQPYLPPEDGTLLVTSEDSIYTVPSLVNGLYVYKLGLPLVQSKTYVIQNNCLSNRVAITVFIPKFFSVSEANAGRNLIGFIRPEITPTLPTGLFISAPAPDVDTSFNTTHSAIIQPGQRFYFTVEFNEEAIRREYPGKLQEPFSIAIDVLDQSGPVYTFTDAPVPHDPNVPETEPELPPVVPEVEVPTEEEEPEEQELVLAWRNGLTGEVVEGSPPEGWKIEADGAAYPPEANDTIIGQELAVIDTKISQKEVQLAEVKVALLAFEHSIYYQYYTGHKHFNAGINSGINMLEYSKKASQYQSNQKKKKSLEKDIKALKDQRLYLIGNSGDASAGNSGTATPLT